MAVSSYEIRKKKTAAGTWDDPVNVGNVLTYDVTGLDPVTPYDFQNRAIDGGGNVSEWSATASATTGLAPAVSVKFLDSVSMTPKYWYGLAKRRTAYAGACIRVKNMTTNVETDVGFDTDGYVDESVLSGLYTAGQLLGVKKFYDQSGNGVDLTVVSAYWTLDFSGFRVGLYTGVASSPNNGYGSAATVNLTNPVFFDAAEFYTIGQSFLFDHGGGNQFSQRNTGGTVFTAKNLYLNNGTAIQSVEPMPYPRPASDGVRILVSRYKAGDEEAWRDGTALTFTGSTNAGDTARAGVTVTWGDFAGGGGLGWNGRVFEHGCLDGTYSSTDKNAIESAMRTHYQDGPLVIWLGDSLTYGTPSILPYVDGPAAKYKLIMPTGRDVVNVGVAGATIPQLESYVPTAVAPMVRPSASRVVVVVGAGTNDAASDFQSGAQIKTRMTSLIAALKALGAEVYLRTIPKQNAWPAQWAAMQAANVLFISDWAAMGADGIINMTGDSHIGNSGNTLDTTYYDPDEAHLTPAGYALIAGYVNAVVP